MARIVRIWIDELVCTTDGSCVRECPEVFEFEDASPYPKIRPDVDRLYEAKDREIREAVSICPYDAIHIEECEADARRAGLA